MLDWLWRGAGRRTVAGHVTTAVRLAPRDEARAVEAVVMAVQLYRGGDRKRDRRTRQWRTARIRHFQEHQRRTREWISFAEIAEWCSKEDQSIVPNNEKSKAAFATLASDLFAGEFQENGRSLVLYLNPETARARMTRDWLQDAIEHNYDGHHGRSQYLSHCWIPRRLFDRWLAKHRLPEAPPRFQPTQSKVAPIGIRTARQPRRGPKPGTVDRYGKSDRALFPEMERIIREGNKSANAAALELVSAGKLKGAGTPESRAKRLATRFLKEHPRPTTR